MAVSVHGGSRKRFRAPLKGLRVDVHRADPIRGI